MHQVKQTPIRVFRRSFLRALFLDLLPRQILQLLLPIFNLNDNSIKQILQLSLLLPSDLPWIFQQLLIMTFNPLRILAVLGLPVLVICHRRLPNFILLLQSQPLFLRIFFLGVFRLDCWFGCFYVHVLLAFIILLEILLKG